MIIRTAYSHYARQALQSIILVLVSWIVSGCDREPMADGKPDNIACNSCHGSVVNAAPPTAVSDAGIGVGAHQAHLVDGRIRRAIECNECHVVPDTVDQASHVDPLPAELKFDNLAMVGGVIPSWNRSDSRCRNTYCHGATLSGGTAPSPIWTTVDGSQVECGSCHGDPPPSPHTSRTNCERCHGQTVGVDGGIDVAGGKHIDGILDTESECNGCHGNQDNDAPPMDTTGNDNVTRVSVGAHQSHLGVSDWHREVLCEDCHVVPDEDTINDESHMDESPAELTWSAFAATDGAAPTFDREAMKCSGVYCHGTTLMEGGTITSPSWTTVDETQSECGTCHGEPPEDEHPSSDSCSVCHSEVIDAEKNIINPLLHINGEVDVGEMECNSCHGSVVNDAPPVDTQGSSDTSIVTVGAHQSHLGASDWHQEVLCEDCHMVPEDVDDDGHLDVAPAELTWGILAGTDAADPTFDRGMETCSGVYCHGTTLLPGGTVVTPSWTTVDDTQAECGTCHGEPPSSEHPSSSRCGACHGMVYDGEDFVDSSLHINGVVDVVEMECNSCHGSAKNNAPPLDTSDNSGTESVTVGAHQSHLDGGSVRSAIPCEECHIVPGEVTDEGHLDEHPADLAWGNLATTGSVVPTWNRTSAQCSNVYCHGATLSGGSNAEPTWTIVDSTQNACGTCHGNPPPPPHPSTGECSQCHPGTVNTEGQIDIAGGRHIDGRVQFEVEGCGPCHGIPPDTGSHVVHFGGAMDDAHYGGTSVTAEIVSDAGVYAFDCGNCHPVDETHHANGVPNAGGGTAEIEMSPSNAPVGSLKARHLSSAQYTPGSTVLEDSFEMSYTEGTCRNIYCHSTSEVSVPGPVPYPVYDSNAVLPEFQFTTFPIDYPDFTVDYGREYSTPVWGGNLTCDGCHGFPPRTFSDTVEAGAGDSHSWIDPQGYENLHGWDKGYNPIACATCHYGTVTEQGIRTRNADEWSVYQAIEIDSVANHVNGKPDVAFTPEEVILLTNHDLTTASYEESSKTCSNVSCHILDTNVVWGTPYRWWNGIECGVCHQY